MMWRHSRVLPGTLAEVLISPMAVGKAAAMPSALSWRVLSGLSHFVATSMVGRPRVTQCGWPHYIRTAGSLPGTAKHTTTYTARAAVPGCYLVHDVVQDQGAVDSGHHVAVDLLGPADPLGGLDVEVLEIQLDERDYVGDALDVQADAVDVGVGRLGQAQGALDEGRLAPRRRRR